MTRALRQKVVVEKGGVIKISSPELAEGEAAEVIVLVEAPTASRKLRSLIGSAKGVYPTPADVDVGIRRERDEWES